MPVGPFGIDPVIWAPLRLIIAVLLAVGLVFNGALAQIYLERKVQAIMQDRLGPLHTGPWGLLQTFADAMKAQGTSILGYSFQSHYFMVHDEAANYSFVLRGYVRHWLANVWSEFDRIKLTDLVGDKPARPGEK